jgi:CubicO group peptidase (beta-lactamase class C family)
MRNGYARGDIGFLTKPLSDRVHRFPEAGGGLFSTTHDIFRYGLLLANDGELDGKRYLSHAKIRETVSCGSSAPERAIIGGLCGVVSAVCSA